MHSKKSLGQNFLMHVRTAARIADAARISSDTSVFEIGPGTGMLTHELLVRSRKVIALEADHELFDEMKGRYADDIALGKLALVHGDIRTFDLGSLPQGYAVVANIPYYLTGEIFQMLLEADNQPSSMTLLVQKEVADRIANSKKESILSLSVKAYGTPKREFLVPRGAFVPAPNVDSAVLTVRGISRKNFATRAEEKRFFDLLHAGFAHKRKFLRSNLVGLVPDGAVPAKARAEDMPLSFWLGLSRG